MTIDMLGFGVIITIGFFGMVWQYRKDKAKRIMNEKPKACEIGRAVITVTVVNAGVEQDYKIFKEGWAKRLIGWNDEQYVHTTTIFELMHQWRERIGKEGMVYVDGDYDKDEEAVYVPLCNVKNIKVKYEKHQVTV
jgi:hypothetical protein